MGVVGSLFGLASASIVGLSLYANRRDFGKHNDALGCAVMLMLFWSASNVLSTLYRPPDWMGVYPIMDVIGFFVAASTWRRDHKVWKSALALCFATQVVLHAVWLHGGMTYGEIYAHTLKLNILFAMQLLCVGSDGVGYVLKSYFDRLFADPRWRSSALLRLFRA